MKTLLLLALITSCITPESPQLKLTEEKNLNVLLFDSLKAAEKLITDPQQKHVHLFNRNYLTNGSKELIEDNLEFGLEELQENEPIEPGSPKFTREDEISWSYCLNDGDSIAPVMTGFFLDYYVSPKLLKDKAALEEFKLWFEQVVVSWMELHQLEPKVKEEKTGEYFRKIIGGV